MSVTIMRLALMRLIVDQTKSYDYGSSGTTFNRGLPPVVKHGGRWGEYFKPSIGKRIRKFLTKKTV